VKKISKITILAWVAILLISANAIAIPIDSNGDPLANTPGFSWIDEPYWTPTDLTTASDGSAIFVLWLEQAAYESDFGLFIVDDVANPTSVVDTLEVFSAHTDDPLSLQGVYFRENNGTWQVSLDNNSYKDFDNRFGFYYGVHTGGAGSLLDYTYYSDPFFNSVDQGDQHVAVEWNGIDNLIIYLEDLRTAAADWDWSDMTIVADDLTPVPEPATMLLLGAGLLGLAGVGRKKKASKNLKE